MTILSDLVSGTDEFFSLFSYDYRRLATPLISRRFMFSGTRIKA